MTRPSQAARVLVVEPTRIFQQLVIRVLEAEGAECVVVGTAADGLRRVDAEKFSVVCVAAVLPDGDGVTFTLNVRRRSHATHTPVVMLSASHDPAAKARALQSGVTEVFHRSEIRTLAKYVEGAVRQASGRIGGRVLLIEDSTAAAKGISRTLSDAGLDVVAHGTADDALAAFEAADFDIIVTDVVPEDAMSGVGLIRRVRALEGSRQRVPILAMSVFDDAARRVELLRAGANDLMPKPFAPEEILARVTNLVATKQLLDRVEAQQANLRTLALTDPLTTLHNRHFLSEAAQANLSDARRNGFAVSVLVFDIDFFKKINDVHGHAQGDRVLCEVAGLIKLSCRGDDIAARFGGEEFVVVLPNCGADEARARADATRLKIASLNPAGLPVTVSVGVTTLPVGRTATFEALFTTADAALYEAKHGGRNRVVVKDFRPSAPPGGSSPERP